MPTKMASRRPRSAWVRVFDREFEMTKGLESAVLKAASRVWAKLARMKGLVDIVNRINLQFDLDQYPKYFILRITYLCPWHALQIGARFKKETQMDEVIRASVAMMKASRFPDDPEYYRDYQSDDGLSWRICMISRAKLPTRFGDFEIYGFHDSRGGLEHTAIVRGQIRGLHDIPVRVHSECHTGDIFGSLRCDCRDQLEAALTYIGACEAGALLYLRQEGRGIGLLNKIQAYNLQDQGRDTVEANEDLGLPAEAREYQAAAAMLSLLGLGSIALMTNNPAKLSALSAAGILISRRIPIVTKPNAHNSRYLTTKKLRMGHLY